MELSTVLEREFRLSVAHEARRRYILQNVGNLPMAVRGYQKPSKTVEGLWRLLIKTPDNKRLHGV